MPSTATITSFPAFSPNTVIKSAEVNNNFSAFRGHIISVDASAASLADGSYDLGAEVYRWRTGYVNSIDFETSTATATLVLQGQTGNTTGAFEFLIEGSTVGCIDATGFKGDASQLTNVPSSQLAVTTVSSVYTATSLDRLILASNATSVAYNVELPIASSVTGQEIIIKKTDSNFNGINIEGNGAETIDGTTTSSVNTVNEALRVVSDGSNWQILERRIPDVITTYTPSSSWSTNSTWTAQWYRTGRYINIDANVALTGAPDATTVSFGLPSGATIATDDLVEPTANEAFFGDGAAIDSGVNAWRAVSRILDSETILINRAAAGTSPSSDVHITIANPINNTSPFTFGSGDSINVNVKVPIAGWKG